MKKIFKILSIFVMVFVLFSCANPSSDSTSGSQPSGSETPVETPTDDTEPSGPETPVETPSDDPVEETPEEPTYSITFTAKNPEFDKPIADLLNSLPDYKNLKEGTEVEFPTIIYEINEKEYTLEITESTKYKGIIQYEGDITSVVVGNKNIEIKFQADNFEGIVK